MEIKLKEEEMMTEPVVISVDELMKYKDIMMVLINFILTSITKSIKSIYFSDDMSDNLKNTILCVIKEFTQPNPSEKTIRRAIDGRYIVTIKYIDGGTDSYTDDKVEFSIQKVSFENADNF